MRTHLSFPHFPVLSGGNVFVSPPVFRQSIVAWENNHAERKGRGVKRKQSLRPLSTHANFLSD